MTFVKDNNGELSDGERRYLIEENEGAKEVYEIKIADEMYEEDSYRIKEDHLLDVSYDEEQIEETMDEYGILEQEDETVDKSVEKDYSEHFENYEAENEDQFEMSDETTVQSASQVSVTRLKVENEEQQKPQQENPPSITVSSPSKNIVDPDERYLMSCLPAFKRFTPQQKAYVRMGIEKLFYEVEFENVSEPKIKRSRIS